MSGHSKWATTKRHKAAVDSNIQAFRAGRILAAQPELILDHLPRDVEAPNLSLDEQIEAYKLLVKYQRNFRLITNMFRKRNPRLAEETAQLAKEIRQHLLNFKK